VASEGGGTVAEELDSEPPELEPVDALLEPPLDALLWAPLAVLLPPPEADEVAGAGEVAGWLVG
jgi:hypothetical protein